jgi:hypothetical protein
MAMSPDPAGRWEVRVHPLGTRTDGCRDDVLDVEIHAAGSVVVGDEVGVSLLAGSWHRAGEGRLVVSAAGRWGTVEAAVELSSDGLSFSGRALARRAVSPAGGRAAVTVVEVEGRRTADPTTDPAAPPLPS